MDKPKPIWVLLHNGKVEFEGSQEDCYSELLNRQRHSVQWAIANDGWDIQKKAGEGPAAE